MQMSSNLVVDCVLPNTAIVPISCSNSIQLKVLKDTLWKEAKKYKKVKCLAAQETYIFVGVTDDSKQTEFYDESKILSELRLISPILKVIEVQLTTEQKAFEDDMKVVFGQSLPYLSEGEEFAAFKSVLLQIIYSASHTKMKYGYKSLAYYKYPPNLDPAPYVDSDLRILLPDGKLKITVWCLDGRSYSLKVICTATPEDVIEEVLQAWQTYPTKKGFKRACTEFSLKICGCDEYLLANQALVQYKTIRSILMGFKEPQLSLIPRKKMYADLLKYPVAPPPNPPIKRKEPDEELSFWHPSLDGLMKIHIKSVHSLDLKSKSVIRTAIYHGEEILSNIVETLPSTGSWNEWLHFNIRIQELPRASKVCFSLCYKKKFDDKKRRKSENEYVLKSYGYFYLFDFKSRLSHGSFKVVFQEAFSNTEEIMQPLGVYAQPSYKDCLQLTVAFEEKYNYMIIFPDEKQFSNYGRYIIKLEKKSKRDLTEEEILSIGSLSSKYPVTDITQEDKEFFWRARHHCSKFPDSLPHLVRSVNWGSRDDVSQFYLLLQDWPPVSLPIALELLQGSFADQRIRNHAVSSISQSTPDEKLSQFLLQLTFALRHEAYIDSPLLRLLLHKCLSNKNLANSFFWYLRSEYLLYSGCRRIATILEAFCRCLGPDLAEFVSRVHIIDRIANIVDLINDAKTENNKDKVKYLQDILSEDSLRCTLQDIRSPLKPSILLGKLKLNECKIIDSARRPLLLVWENSDPMAHYLTSSHGVLFKGRDDLRQDMLTLQTIGVMSQVWIQEGLNLCMTPYNCLVTGNKVGLIEVVQNAKTVYSIQKRAKLGALQVDSSQLLKWIKDHNPGKNKQLD